MMRCLALIALLHLIQAIKFLHAHIDCPPEKVPINLNISNFPPDKILTTPYGAFLEGIYFNVSPEHEEGYKIGQVRDGNVVISEDAENVVSKQVFSVIHPDGSKFVEIDITSRTDSGAVEKRIEEYVRRSRNLPYVIVVRDSLEIDITRAESDPRIHVATVGGQKVFFVRDIYKMTFLLGIIKYEELTLEEDINDVLYKYIVLETGYRPVVRVMSYFRNGTSRYRVYEIEIKRGWIASRILRDEILDVI